MTPTNIEKLERRQVAASDLAAAAELPVTIGGVPVEQVASIGKFCTSADASSPTSALQSSVMYEKSSTSNQVLDVNRDGFISPLDADLILASLYEEPTTGPMPEPLAQGEDTSEPNYDVNSDGNVTAADVLAVINRVHFYSALVPCTCPSCLARSAEGTT